MTHSLVLRLMLKDWYLTRTTLAAVTAVGALSVSALFLRQGLTSLLGMMAALIAVIFLGTLMPQLTILNERKRQNLAFVMSLPVSPMQYTTAKVLGNLAGFLALWLPITLGMIGTVVSAGVYGGIIPLMVIAALAPFAGFALFLCVAIVVESEVLALTTMAACNVAYSFVWLLLTRIPNFLRDLSSPIAIWTQPVLWIIAVEVVAIVLSLGATFYFQSKKTDFI